MDDLLSADGTDFGVLAQSFDESYFAQGENASVDGIDFFSRARAASAMDFARRGEPAEAIYEAISAVDDSSELREIVSRDLGGVV